MKRKRTLDQIALSSIVWIRRDIVTAGAERALILVNHILVGMRKGDIELPAGQTIDLKPLTKCRKRLESVVEKIENAPAGQLGKLMAVVEEACELLEGFATAKR